MFPVYICDNSQNKNKFKCSIVKDKEEIFTQIIDNPNFEWYPENAGEFEFSVQCVPGVSGLPQYYETGCHRSSLLQLAAPCCAVTRIWKFLQHVLGYQFKQRWLFWSLSFALT